MFLSFVAFGQIRFGVIGDYGRGFSQERDVADLIKSWNPDFITTVGDNNYPTGQASTIDKNIGQFFHEYIGNYQGSYGDGSPTNRFFPTLGHRDWDTDNAQPYLDYFTLLGNERYYDFVKGSVHFFILDTDTREPDGTDTSSTQALWLKQGLANSTSVWNLVYVHHAPYTSHTVEDNYHMRWPFASWGADAILSGFFHIYERLEVDGIPYFITGNGGSTVSNFGEIDSHSKFRYNGDFGAMLIEASDTEIVFKEINRQGVLIETYKIDGNVPIPKTLTITSPNGGESVGVGSTESIEWGTTGDITNVKIEYTVDGSTWKDVVASTENDGSYDWTVPNDASKAVKIRISDVGGTTTDESNTVFEIAKVVGVYHKALGKYSITIKGSVLYSDKPIEGIRLFDLSGNIVWDGVGVNPGLSGGVYILKMIYEGGDQNMQKIFVGK